ncbi:MAG: insulinase family protein [Candidatus Tectomicrobia bacterium]|nr:insulinase family protein [Candidatus Tectomicrobia bacterium]
MRPVVRALAGVFFVILLSAGLLAGTVGPGRGASAPDAAPAATAPTPSFNLEARVIEHRLDNGMLFLIVRRPFAPTVAMNLRFKVGSVDEASGETGMAHMLEHMLFKGTETLGTTDFERERTLLAEIDARAAALDAERRKGEAADAARLATLRAELQALQERQKQFIDKDGQIDALYTRNGGVGFNATTGRDFTTYFISLPANRLELWARIEADRMVNPVLRSFYAEREVVLEERRMRYESEPGGKLYEQFLALAYQAHPYRNPTIGWPSDIAFLNRAATERFYRDHYGPNNAVVAIVGDVDPQALIPLLRRYFGPIPAAPARPRLVTAEPPRQGERRAVVRFKAEPRLVIGFQKPTAPHRDDYIFDLIDRLLTSGRTSRLYRSIVEERQLAASVSTSNGVPGVRDDNLFAIFATPRHPHTAAEVEAAILAELEGVKKGEVSERDLQKVKNQLEANFIRGLRSNSGLAGQLTYYQAGLGDWRYITRYPQAIATIGVADVQKAAQQYFKAANRTVVTMLPPEEEP